ncbi:MAG: PatB family C-S lyase [Desulfobacterales bacterium]
MFDFDAVIDRRGTASEKWERYAGRDILPMWVADMDFRSPPVVIAALQRRLDHGVFGYTAPPAGLVEAIRAHLAATYGWEVGPEWIVFLPGLGTGLNVVCRAVGEDHDDVLTLVPIYPPFLAAPRFARRGLVAVRLAESQGRWEIDFERLEASLTPRSRLFLFCNPHNPVGRVYRRRELEAVAEFCLRSGLTVCSDEIHAGLVLEPGLEHRPLATLDPEIARRTITLLSPSKTFNLAGLGCGFAVIPSEELRRRFRRAMAGIVPMINPFGYAAAEAAYREGEPWRRALVAYLRENRDRLTRTLSALPGGLAAAPVEGTYLAWIDVRASGLREPVAFFEKAGVGLQDGREFAGPGFVRLNFGCPRSLLEIALERMAHALEEAFRRGA